jgi:signal transduction histidine kinase
MSSETPSQPAFPESSGRVRTPRDTGSIESPSGIGRYAAGGPVRPSAGSATQGSSAGHGKLSGVQPLRKRKWHEGILGKLGVALAFVFAMLLIPAGSGLYGLYRFREVVHDLDYGINEAPHQADLVTAIGALVDPVLTLVSPDETAKPAGPYFQLAHQQCQGAVVLFRRKLAAMPEGAMSVEARAVTTTLLDQIDKELAELDVLHVRTADATLRPVVVRKMHELVSRLVVAAQQVPDPVEGMRRILSDSRRVYSSTAAYIIGSGLVVLVLFAVLMWWVGRGVVFPLRDLHAGAQRVSQGEFDHRLHVGTRDEIADLAHSFNLMTLRFQEIRADLDRQVNERSQQLVRSERLAGIGFLAAGVAHEINNPLSAICMAAESLEERVAPLLENDDPGDAAVVKQYLRMMQTESFRCRQITERLLDFSRGRDQSRDLVDLTHLVREVVAMVQYLSKYRERRIEFEREEACYAEVNGAEVKQVVLNLIANALDAMDKGGTLRISLEDQTDQVVLEFRDNGCGMSSETLSHIFEPFFTNKQDGQGTGLGLSITHRIVQQHGGTICAASAGPDAGSTFVVRLPRKAAQRSAA